jgi:hypothetical protein
MWRQESNNMSQPIQLPVLIASLATKVDGSIKVTLVTRELGGDDAARLFSLRGSEAWALIAPQEFTEDSVKLPTEKADPSVGTKTPSQRLRGVLYRLWEQNRSGTDFESFYRIKMEGIIEQFKGRLD